MRSGRTFVIDLFSLPFLWSLYTRFGRWSVPVVILLSLSNFLHEERDQRRVEFVRRFSFFRCALSRGSFRKVGRRLFFM